MNSGITFVLTLIAIFKTQTSESLGKNLQNCSTYFQIKTTQVFLIFWEGLINLTKLPSWYVFYLLLLPTCCFSYNKWKKKIRPTRCFLKLSFSEKATKICAIFLMVCLLSKTKIAQIFVPFSQKLNFMK